MQLTMTYAWLDCFVPFQSLNVPDAPSVSPSKSTKVGKKYGLSKGTSKAKDRKNKDRLMVSLSTDHGFNDPLN